MARARMPWNSGIALLMAGCERMIEGERHPKGCEYTESPSAIARKEGVGVGIGIGIGVSIRRPALIGLGAKPRRSGQGAVVDPQSLFGA